MPKLSKHQVEEILIEELKLMKSSLSLSRDSSLCTREFQLLVDEARLREIRVNAMLELAQKFYKSIDKQHLLDIARRRYEDDKERTTQQDQEPS